MGRLSSAEEDGGGARAFVQWEVQLPQPPVDPGIPVVVQDAVHRIVDRGVLVRGDLATEVRGDRVELPAGAAEAGAPPKAAGIQPDGVRCCR